MAVSAQSSDPEGTVAAAIKFVVAQAIELLQARRIWLFGSRARASAHRVSDIDIALEAMHLAHPNWGKFSAIVHEDAPTLLDIDLVDIDACSCDLRRTILKEGRILYER